MFQLFLTREFAKEKARATKSGEFQKLREKQIIEDAYNHYLDWITQAGNITIKHVKNKNKYKYKDL